MSSIDHIAIKGISHATTTKVCERSIAYIYFTNSPEYHLESSGHTQYRLRQNQPILYTTTQLVYQAKQVAF